MSLSSPVPSRGRSTRRRLALATLALLASQALAPAALAESFGWTIRTAETAAPPAISAEATVYYMDPLGVVLQVRRGTNGWWCMAPSQADLGPRVPLCGDAVALDWLRSWLGQDSPTPGASGVIYALAGGRDASAVNPFRAEPVGTHPWLVTGPHVMIVNPPAEVMALYPARAEPDTSAPYVMWPETPFAHLRLPVE